MLTATLAAMEEFGRNLFGLRLPEIPDDCPVARLVDLLLERAVSARASALRMSPIKGGFVVEVQLASSGPFLPVVTPPPRLERPIIDRLAVLGGYRNRHGPQRCAFERSFGPELSNVRPYAPTGEDSAARFEFEFALPHTPGPVRVIRQQPPGPSP